MKTSFLFSGLIMAAVQTASAAATNAAPAPPPPANAAAQPAPAAATNGAASAAAPAAKDAAAPAAAANAPAAASAPAPQPPPTGFSLAGYVADLTDRLHLSDTEKKDIQSYYETDGTAIQGILNDATLSPLQQTDKVSALRDQRNAKIEALLGAVDRRHEFAEVEAQDRVALIELAANGGLTPAQPPAPAPSPSDMTPAAIENTPSAKSQTK